MFTVIVTGSRAYTDWEKVWKELEDLYLAHGTLWVVHGGCPSGADSFAEMWVHSWYFPRLIGQTTFSADWDNCIPECPPGHRRVKPAGDTVHPGSLPDYCPGAGPRRNRQMAEAGADLVLAFPLGKSYGTWNCVNTAKKAGIPVKVVDL